MVHGVKRIKVSGTAVIHPLFSKLFIFLDSFFCIFSYLCSVSFTNDNRFGRAMRGSLSNRNISGWLFLCPHSNVLHVLNIETTLTLHYQYSAVRKVFFIPHAFRTVYRTSPFYHTCRCCHNVGHKSNILLTKRNAILVIGSAINTMTLFYVLKLIGTYAVTHNRMTYSFLCQTVRTLWNFYLSATLMCLAAKR